MFTRRGFVQVTAASVGSLALRPFGLLPATETRALSSMLALGLAMMLQSLLESERAVNGSTVTRLQVTATSTLRICSFILVLPLGR